MFLARLLRRVRRRPDLHFTLFTRQGCHLCDTAEAILRRQQERYQYGLETKDVDNQPEWIEQYGECVPVVLVNGKLRFRGNVNEVLLQRILDADG